MHVFNNFIFNIWLFVSSKPWQDVGEPHVDFYCIHSASNITRFKCLLNENNEITFYVHWMSFISIFIFSSWTYVKHIVSMKTKRNINSTHYLLIQKISLQYFYKSGVHFQEYHVYLRYQCIRIFLTLLHKSNYHHRCYDQ